MKLSIVLPNKNQGRKLVSHLLDEGLPFFEKMGVVYEVIIVPNACNEEELAYLEEAKKDLPIMVHVLEPLPLGGKGRAVKAGIEAASGDYVMFMDADFATSLEAFGRVLPRISNSVAWIGSRNAKGSIIPRRQPFTRRVLHSGSRFLCRHLFSLTKLTDTQCGFKFFRRNVAKKMIERQITTGAAFDVEYLYFLALNGFSIVEIPVTWTDDPDSSFSHPFKAALSFFVDLIKIRRNKKGYLLSKEEKEALGC